MAPEAFGGLSQYKVKSNSLGLGFKENFLLLIFLITFLLPSSLIYYLFKIKMIASIQLEDLQSRRLPYFFTFIIYLAFSIFLYLNLPVFKEIIICLFAITLSLLCVAVISLFWQISAHLVGISGVSGALLSIILKKEASQLFIPLLISLLLVGIVASARLKLNAHNPKQVIAGSILGFLVSIIFTFLLF